MKSLAPYLLSIAVLAGCPSNPKRPSLDGGTDGSVTTDGSTSDGGSDDGGGMDVDASEGFDAGPPTDSGPPGAPSCEPGTACGAGDSCASGTTCITNACGAKVCVPSGASCSSSEQCAAGSGCTSTASGSFCAPTNGQVCNASTDCPPSHTCEGALGARACVLRRIPCIDESQCPVSYQCLASPGDSSTCQYGYRPCELDADCNLQTCLDIDSDGATECGSGGGCETNADCSAPERCVLTPTGARCGRGGLCDESGGDDCGSGYECLDLAGDGYGECVATGGSCSSTSPCSGGAICGVRAEGSAPECITSM